MAPEGDEMVGDVSNVTFSNGWIAEDDGTVFIYYASSDLRMHVAISSIEKLLDYVISTPEDGFTSKASVKTIMKIIEQNDSTEGRDGEEPTKNYVLVRS
jgi:4-O-beta-D-mannosyl-D-glucose phosphorylase